MVVAGSNWNEANQAALAANESPDTFMVHPFNQPSTWEGHSTLISELADQLETSPACVVTCVGGGGLAMGLLQGMDKLSNWENVPLVTMETEGANCLLAARRAGQLVTLPAITSIATSLGALAVAENLLQYCLNKVEKYEQFQIKITNFKCFSQTRSSPMRSQTRMPRDPVLNLQQIRGFL